MNMILMYEELALNAHPALQTQFYDGWVLRFAKGYTKRANSINPIYPYTLNLHEKIMECEKKYAAHGLSAVFKLTDGSNQSIDRALEDHGYEIIDQDFIMSVSFLDKMILSGDCLITRYADKEWLSAYNDFKHFSGTDFSTAKKILENTKSPMICARLVKGGVSVACGTSVVDCGYAILLNVIVNEPYRGKGFGKVICESLMRSSLEAGAHTAFLQVMKNNHVAISLYEKLGFKVIYSDWYRVKKGNDQK